MVAEGLENQLSKHIGTYLQRLKYNKLCSDHTARAYTFELNLFEEFLLNQKIEWQHLSPQNISQWLLFLNKQKLSPRTISRNLSVLRNFFNSLVEEGVIKTNPFMLFSAPKAQKTIPTVLSSKEMVELLNKMPVNSVLERRNKCLLVMMYSTGLRAEEVCNIPKSNVLFRQNAIKVLGKGGKERMVPLLPVASQYLSEWIEDRGSLDKGISDALFLSNNGRPLTSNMIYKIIDKSSELHYKKIHPHVFRYTFATHLLDHDANLRCIQELLGHANLAVTQRYTKISISHLQQKFNKFHPRA